ncbi:restriction endonuclease subunit S [Enterocloster clostridioformis]|uniref:Type I restriction modification DNA specificity domain-containing protein n=1 Tax=[Clostridium] clostridioforme 90A8 TaxID=999408 RepID=A0A0E2H3L6_9FIRM|nr:restriction endonuclease subunit S [Enterocloster clostridioformis]ENZ07392.1 hypothetical protein HMPREF1090_05245 [[Clostridium] clostridioforme 90A8]
MKSNYDILGNHIRLIDTRNRESITDRVLGINIDKFFMPSVANVIGTDLSKYKLITKGKFACNPMHVGRDERLPVALYDEEEPAIVSPAYFMFEVVDNSILNEDYLMMWFRRPEFDRICWLHTDGSVRGGITWDDICRLELPIPPIEKQLEIVNSYKAITERIALKKKINDNLDATMQAIYKSYFIDLEPFQTESMQKTKLGNIPLTWKVCKFNEICELLNGRAYSQEELLNSGKYRVLRVGNFFTQSNWYYSNMELEDNKYCYPDDLLFCWSASFGLYIWNDIKTIYHYHIWKIDFSKSSQLYREYIYLYLRQEVQKLSKEGHGSVMAHLTKNGVENLDIISPSSEVVEDFHNKILPFIEHKKILEKEIQRLDALRETYLSQLAN